MTKRHLIRYFALIGAAASATAYVGFLMAGLNDGGPRIDDLWRTVFFAPANMVVGWVIFSASGIAAFTFRSKLADRLLFVSAGLVGLPIFWAVAIYLFYDQPRGIWPGFQDEVWRWFVTYIYAGFAFGILLGFIGLAATTADSNKPAAT